MMSPTLNWPGAPAASRHPTPLALNTLTWPQVLELLLSGFSIAYFLGDSACLFFFLRKTNKKTKWLGLSWQGARQSFFGSQHWVMDSTPLPRRNQISELPAQNPHGLQFRACMLTKLTKAKTGTRAGSKCKAEGKCTRLRGLWSWGPAGAYLLQQGQRLGAGQRGEGGWVSRMEETTGSVPKQKTGLRNKNWHPVPKCLVLSPGLPQGEAFKTLMCLYICACVSRRLCVLVEICLDLYMLREKRE